MDSSHKALIKQRFIKHIRDILNSLGLQHTYKINVPAIASGLVLLRIADCMHTSIAREPRAKNSPIQGSVNLPQALYVDRDNAVMVMWSRLRYNIYVVSYTGEQEVVSREPRPARSQ